MEMLKNMPWYGYVFLGVVILSMLLRKLPIKDIIRVLRTKDFTKNPSNPNLEYQQQIWINIGAIIGEQTSCYVNSLETGVDKNRLTKGLSEWWDVHDEESAYEALKFLKEDGHRHIFKTIYPIYKSGNTQDWDRTLSEIYKDEERYIKSTRFINNLSETYNDLVKEGYTADDFDRGIMAWDMGRLVVVARMCYDLQWIDEKTAWGLCRIAYDNSKREFTSWEQFSKSYIIGRAIWGGNNMMLGGIKQIAESLLTKDSSPWKLTPW